MRRSKTIFATVATTTALVLGHAGCPGDFYICHPDWGTPDTRLCGCPAGMTCPPANDPQGLLVCAGPCVPIVDAGTSADAAVGACPGRCMPAFPYGWSFP